MGVFGTDSFLARPRRKMFLVDAVARGMEMVICFGSVPFSPCCMSGSHPSFSLLCPWIVVVGLVVSCGMAGCLDSVVLWAASFVQLACCELDRRLGAYPVDGSAFWTPPDYWDADVGDV